MLGSERRFPQHFSCPVQFHTAPVPKPPGHRLPRPFRPTHPGYSAWDGIPPDLSVNPLLRFSTERCPSKAFPVFGGAAGTARTEPLPPILTKAAAACFTCRIAVNGRSLSPPFQRGSPNALNKRQVCYSGYWTDVDILSSMPVGCCNRRAWCRLNTPLHEVCSAYGVLWVRRQTRICPDDMRLALRSIEELPRNGPVRVMLRNSSQCELPQVEHSEGQTSASRNSWNGVRNVYSNVSGTTSPASSENECWFLGELVAATTQKDWIWDFSPVSVKNRKRAQRHSRPVEVQKKNPLVICLPCSHRGLCLWRTLLVLQCHASSAMDTI